MRCWQPRRSCLMLAKVVMGFFLKNKKYLATKWSFRIRRGLINMFPLTVPAVAAPVYSLAPLLEMRQTAALINGLWGTFPHVQLPSTVVNKKCMLGQSACCKIFRGLRDTLHLRVPAPALRTTPGNDTQAFTHRKNTLVFVLHISVVFLDAMKNQMLSKQTCWCLRQLRWEK